LMHLALSTCHRAHVPPLTTLLHRGRDAVAPLPPSAWRTTPSSIPSSVIDSAIVSSTQSSTQSSMLGQHTIAPLPTHLSFAPLHRP
jgi:hypothetical protein